MPHSAKKEISIELSRVQSRTDTYWEAGRIDRTKDRKQHRTRPNRRRQELINRCLLEPSDLSTSTSSPPPLRSAGDVWRQLPSSECRLYWLLQPLSRRTNRGTTSQSIGPCVIGHGGCHLDPVQLEPESSFLRSARHMRRYSGGFEVHLQEHCNIV